MPSPDREPLLRTNFFRVLIDDVELGFAEISRLSSTTDDEPGQTRRHRFETVVLRRALTHSRDLYAWRRHILDGKDDRRTVTIQQLEAGGGVANAWRLVAARPVRWSGPDFDAMESRIAYEEVEVEFDDLVWLEQTPT